MILFSFVLLLTFNCFVISLYGISVGEGGTGVGASDGWCGEGTDPLRLNVNG